MTNIIVNVAILSLFIKGFEMKKIIALTAIAAACSTSAFAGNFEGWSVTAAAESAKSTLSGGPVIITSTGAQMVSSGAQISSVDGSGTASGLKLGVAYGLPIASTLTTFGIDYSTAKAGVDNNVAANGVVVGTGKDGLTTDVKSRTDLYVAPGFLINQDSLIYAKVGYSTFSYAATDANGTDPAHGGSAGKSGAFYGIGYKQTLDKNSPYFFTVEYIAGKTSNDKITGSGDNNTPIYVNSNNKFSSFSIGLGYSFK